LRNALFRASQREITGDANVQSCGKKLSSNRVDSFFLNGKIIAGITEPRRVLCLMVKADIGEHGMATQGDSFDAEGEMVEYYSRLSPRYESKAGVGIPMSPEQKAYRQRLLPFFTKDLAGRDVLEVACGPGSWTHEIAPFVKSVVAVDINESTLIEARKKSYPEGRVRFVAADNYTLEWIRQGLVLAHSKEESAPVPGRVSFEAAAGFTRCPGGYVVSRRHDAREVLAHRRRRECVRPSKDPRRA
jgi:SAM-dependent methyltransferase